MLVWIRCIHANEPMERALVDAYGVMKKIFKPGGRGIRSHRIPDVDE
jgi:hypothetical protein